MMDHIVSGVFGACIDSSNSEVISLGEFRNPPQTPEDIGESASSHFKAANFVRSTVIKGFKMFGYESYIPDAPNSVI